MANHFNRKKSVLTSAIILFILFLFQLALFAFKQKSEPTQQSSNNDSISIVFEHNFEHNTLGEYNEKEWRKDWNNPPWANNSIGYGKIVQENNNKFLEVPFPEGSFFFQRRWLAMVYEF
jgi:hypothetical protein